MAVNRWGRAVSRKRINHELHDWLALVLQRDGYLVICPHAARVADAWVARPEQRLSPQPGVPLRVQALRWAVEQLTGEASEDTTIAAAVRRIDRSRSELSTDWV